MENRFLLGFIDENSVKRILTSDGFLKLEPRHLT